MPKKYRRKTRAKKYRGGVLESVPIEERTVDVCLEAISHYEREFRFIPEELQHNPDFCLKAATINGLTLKFMSSKLPNYRQICLAAIKQDGRAFKIPFGSFQDDEFLAYAKYSDNPLDFRTFFDTVAESYNRRVKEFLEPLAEKSNTAMQGFLDSKKKLSHSAFKEYFKNHANIDIDPDILIRFRKEYPDKKEQAWSNDAAERDAASYESKSAIAEEAARNKFIAEEEAARNKFIPLVRPEEPKESPSTKSPRVFRLIDVDAEAVKRIERADKIRISKAEAELERAATEPQPQSIFEADKERAEKIRISKAEAELERAATDPQPQSREKERLEKFWKSQEDAELERAATEPQPLSRDKERLEKFWKSQAEAERLEKFWKSQEHAESEKPRRGGKTRKKRKTRKRR